MTNGTNKLLNPNTIYEHPIVGWGITGLLAYGGMLGGFTLADRAPHANDFGRGGGLIAGLVGGVLLGVVLTNVIYPEKES